MAGIFDLKKGAFDSSEAGRLYKAYDIALHGLRATHEVDQAVVHRLARSIVKVARTEADCLNNDGTIDPVRLAQRAILRMLQLSAPSRQCRRRAPRRGGARRIRARGAGGRAAEDSRMPSPADSTSRIMMKIFDRTNFSPSFRRERRLRAPARRDQGNHPVAADRPR